MKLFVVCLLGLVALSMAVPTSPLLPEPYRGCRHILGKCVEECPKGTHEYHTHCSPLTPEATCEEPNPVEKPGDVCDYSKCFCNHPTVRNTVTGMCVKLEDCPKK